MEDPGKYLTRQKAMPDISQKSKMTFDISDRILEQQKRQVTWYPCKHDCHGKHSFLIYKENRMLKSKWKRNNIEELENMPYIDAVIKAQSICFFKSED